MCASKHLGYKTHPSKNINFIFPKPNSKLHALLNKWIGYVNNKVCVCVCVHIHRHIHYTNIYLQAHNGSSLAKGIIGMKEMFYLTMHSTHFIYGYMASNIWLRTILIVRKETHCHHIGYTFRLTARVLLYAPSHRQDSTYHGLCYTSHGALTPYEGSIQRPIVPWTNALTTEQQTTCFIEHINRLC